MVYVAQIFGLTFVGIIVICIVITFGSYLAESFSPNNKLEENIKNFNKLNKKYK
tara:strand:+ start:51 stop:212 length:162 start_codon:yes stop_codon:yes gene_type:complete